MLGENAIMAGSGNVSTYNLPYGESGQGGSPR